MHKWEAAIPAVSIARAVSVMPPPKFGKGGGLRSPGDAILTVLILEAVIVVALDVLEKFRALWRHHRAIILIVGPNKWHHDNVARGEGHLRRYLRRYLVTLVDIWSRCKDI